ncbi:bifunctional uridylyltransferase/uridylyl-removing protein GlnD [Aeromonas simiae]|uniref:bifunctional uridylyltransferase/uridylyl-removing protein GlnD n=1 Tax=Aeromonas simiae TaxID=218936 RepID=UPI00266CFD28|nr:bifunctional uridylyltransferase/uridylyl-removing protein GlnD [Aeromonas simiae]MDO2947010.1 bifunctional uridylyltransferase/uridylyl-removing protein GlnD [Aeromonas simiae]MDO2950622.1 bifunctional uridylyltransferase/uridylyl-removing protein GlnD [Aeromonas simiae]MDO2954396.1 bifunctional uridylyltransferase/uridylyl-removing protein GlnD [Aeromonas simiae]
MDDLSLLPSCAQPLEREAYRSALHLFSERLAERFRQGEPVTQLVAERSRFMDALLTQLWQQFGFDKVAGLTLIAVGGYGRGELHPHSDIDLLLLYQEEPDEVLGLRIGDFIALLWDLRLEVGQSVRSVAECVAQGERDITVATNLIEARYITGHEPGFVALQAATAPSLFWPSEAFFEAKRQEQIDRHRQFQGTAYKLEPDIKSNPGGMRDIQTLAWVARRHFGATSLAEMSSQGFLNQAEYQELQDCQTFLWQVRFALHLAINRGDNRLLFDRQRTVAEILGFTGEGNGPVEQMMKRFYQTVRRVAELNEMLLQLFDEAILGNSAMDVRRISDEFQLRGRLIDAVEPDLFGREPAAILRLFYQIAQHPNVTGIHSATLRQLREARRKLGCWLQDIPECRRLFIALLRHPGGIGLPLTLMHKYGILAAYLPQWHLIVGQMQFDMFHAYTVDEHTHRLFKHFHFFTDPASRKPHPLCHELFNQLRKPELLFVAALFHDIAKGRKGDHSELGAVDALEFCQLHGFDRYESRLVAWLVRHHLLMSVTAQRRDIYDPDVITDFAQKVRDELHLELLCCLTVADICATNDTLWNDWKGTLLRELFFATQKALRQGLENPPDMRLKIRENQRQARQLLGQQQASDEAVTLLWSDFKADYFLRHTPEQIAWHTRHILAHADPSVPLVLVGKHPSRGGSELFIYCRDMPNLFATVASALDQKNLNIHDAQIMSSRTGFVLDTFIVLEPNGQPISPNRIATIKGALEKALEAPGKLVLRSKPLSRRHRQFNVPTRVTFLPHKGEVRHTLVELIALDAPGLLARIGAVFQQCGLALHAAKITTIGERVEDFFSLTTLEGEPLNLAQQRQLEERLIQQLAELTEG